VLPWADTAAVRERQDLHKRKVPMMARLKRPVSRQAGIALVVVTVTVAVLGATVADFAYNSRVDLEAAANARDQLRAEYLARSGIQLARLLIKTQQSVLDRNRQFVGDIQLMDFAPYLIKAFGGEADERAGLGALLGIDVSGLKGLGAGKGATFDLTMNAEDGKLNVNCGGGLNDVPHQQQLYAVLSALFWPPRYNRMFEMPDAEGQYATRDDVARAIVDWADIDEQKFDPQGNGSGSESDYRYDATRDPYRAHNHLYDTVEELNLVRGVGDEFWGSFGEMLTVYGGCLVNISAIKPDNWPLMAAILRATADKTKSSSQALTDDVTMAQLSQMVLGMAQMMGGFKDTNTFIQCVANPQNCMGSMFGGSSSSSSSSSNSSSTVAGVNIDANLLKSVATTGPRRIYRLDAVGTIQRTREKKIEVRIRGVWDSAHYNQNTLSPDPNDRQGTWIYWRQD
jgi:general secretion pathway protein K